MGVPDELLHRQRIQDGLFPHLRRALGRPTGNLRWQRHLPRGKAHYDTLTGINGEPLHSTTVDQPSLIEKQARIARVIADPHPDLFEDLLRRVRGVLAVTWGGPLWLYPQLGLYDYLFLKWAEDKTGFWDRLVLEDPLVRQETWLSQAALLADCEELPLHFYLLELP